MNKQSYLNIGSATRYSSAKEWVNIDASIGIEGDTKGRVRYCNANKPLAFSEFSFDAVYHSHVLEHIPRQKVKQFLKECYRVLKKDGILRISIPDLEKLAKEYLEVLHENLKNPTVVSNINYRYVMYKLVGLLTAQHSEDSNFRLTEKERKALLGVSKEKLMFIPKKTRDKKILLKIVKKIVKIVKMPIRHLLYTIKNKIIATFSNKYKIGLHRTSGHVHLWMYDRYSLVELLKETGFKNVEIKTAFESSILNWPSYHLDVDKHKKIIRPESLYIEAKK